MLPWHIWDQRLWEGNLPMELSLHLQQGKDSRLGWDPTAQLKINR